MRDLTFVRLLRTPHSERFMLRAAGADVGALEAHYLADGAVDATLILFEEAGTSPASIPDLLKQIDETLFPGVSLSERNLLFTVVSGQVLGAFEPHQDSGPPTPALP